MFVGSEFNYSQELVIHEPTYKNVSTFLDYYEVTAVNKQIFNFSEREKAYGHLCLPQNTTLPINASVVISQPQDAGSYPGGTFFVVNATISKLISENASLYYNYKNSTAPLNISSTNYTYGSVEIPAYKLTAVEPKYSYAAPGQSQSYVIVKITFMIDSSNGIVLFESQNLTYAETTYYDTYFTIQGTNFQMVGSPHSTTHNWLGTVIGISILAAIFLIALVARSRGR